MRTMLARVVGGVTLVTALLAWWLWPPRGPQPLASEFTIHSVTMIQPGEGHRAPVDLTISGGSIAQIEPVGDLPRGSDCRCRGAEKPGGRRASGSALHARRSRGGARALPALVRKPADRSPLRRHGSVADGERRQVGSLDLLRSGRSGTQFLPGAPEHSMHFIVRSVAKHSRPSCIDAAQESTITGNRGPAHACCLCPRSSRHSRRVESRHPPSVAPGHRHAFAAGIRLSATAWLCGDEGSLYRLARR